MKATLDHFDITVRDMKIAEPFYDNLLPLLGFDLSRKGGGYVKDHDFHVVEYPGPDWTFTISSPREQFKDVEIHRRRPGSLHHLAFRLESTKEVDAMLPLIEATGAQIVDEPKYYPQHGETYYALFFKDLEGIKYELMYES